MGMMEQTRLLRVSQTLNSVDGIPLKNFTCTERANWMTVVSRAFQVLSDSEKKAKFDRFGGDPDNRFGPGSAPSASPFSGFARSPGAGRGPMFEDEISPEELFNRFFGGGMGGGAFGESSFTKRLRWNSLTVSIGGGGMFDNGPQYVFNLGGGPGFRVHQFGGGRPRRRPREANGTTDEPPQTTTSALSNLLPLLILFILPLLSSIFSTTTPAGPSFLFDSPKDPYTMHRRTSRLKINYYINPKDVVDYSGRKMSELDRLAENKYVSDLQYECQAEQRQRNRLIDEAQGWFFQDEDKIRKARNLDMRSCRRLQEVGLSTGSY